MVMLGLLKIHSSYSHVIAFFPVWTFVVVNHLYNIVIMREWNL